MLQPPLMTVPPLVILRAPMPELPTSSSPLLVHVEPAAVTGGRVQAARVAADDTGAGADPPPLLITSVACRRCRSRARRCWSTWSQRRQRPPCTRHRVQRRRSRCCWRPYHHS